MNVRTTLGITFASTGTFLLLLVAFGFWREHQGSTQHLEFSKLYVEAFSVIVVSFFVGLMGILIPARLQEVQQDFQRLKESRIAYSEAKTGVSYLPLRLCILNLPEAAAFIQQVHFQKHQAQLYKELEDHVRPDWPSGAAWAKEMLDRLNGFRDALEKRAPEWDALDRGDRMKLLLAARACVEEELAKREAEEEHPQAKAAKANSQ